MPDPGPRMLRGPRSGGLTTKVHLAAEGNCLPIAFVLIPDRPVSHPHLSRCQPGLGCTDAERSVAPRSGPFPDQVSPEGHQERCFRLSTAVRNVYHQQTKNLLVSYSAQKLGFF